MESRRRRFALGRRDDGLELGAARVDLLEFRLAPFLVDNEQLEHPIPTGVDAPHGRPGRKGSRCACEIRAQVRGLTYSIVQCLLNTAHMASSLGDEIRRARLKAGIGLRELARRIEKSPAYVVALERAEESPGVTEETLVAIAAELSLSPDVLMTLASKVPAEVKPKSALEIELYRMVRQLPVDRQRALLAALNADGSVDAGEQDPDKEGGGRDRR